MIYVVALMVEGKMEQRKEILDAIAADDWFVSELAALATADQYNARVLEELLDRQYASGDFNLMGVFKFSLEGLVGTYDN